MNCVIIHSDGMTTCNSDSTVLTPKSSGCFVVEFRWQEGSYIACAQMAPSAYRQSRMIASCQIVESTMTST